MTTPEPEPSEYDGEYNRNFDQLFDSDPRSLHDYIRAAVVRDNLDENMCYMISWLVRRIAILEKQIPRELDDLL